MGAGQGSSKADGRWSIWSFRGARSRRRQSTGRVLGWLTPLAVAGLLLVAAPAEGSHSPGSVSSGITAGPDGNLWAAVWHEPALYRVTPSGQISEVDAGGPEGPLAAGADGNLWGEAEHSSWGGTGGYPGIARISPSGQVAFFPPPASPVSQYETDGITAGPDGNMWFTSGLVNGYNEVVRVSRITPSGQVTPFPIPLSLIPGLTSQDELAPREITAGGGVLWMLTERGLVRVTTEGQMSLLPIMATQANPTGLAYGPDGNLWAVYAALAPTSLQVRQITPTGVVSAIPVPGVHTGGAGAVGITSGPDGAVWLADGSRILRITTGGAVTEFPTGLPSTDQAEAITTGPDGNLWFTAGSVIGRITTSGSVTVFPLPGLTLAPAPLPTRPAQPHIIPHRTVPKTVAQCKKRYRKRSKARSTCIRRVSHKAKTPQGGRRHQNHP